MNTKLMVLMTVAIALVLPGTAHSQVQWAGGTGYAQPSPSQTYLTGSQGYMPGAGSPYSQPAAAYPAAGYATAGYPVASYMGQQQKSYRMPATQPSGVAPASYCADGSCESPCVGACGGSCGGGCGLLSGGGGPLQSILGGSMFGGLGGGLGSGTGGGWFDAEYLLWWNKERYIPALVTQSPSTTPLNAAGQLGQSTTQVVFGDSLIGNGPYSGVRVGGGKWLDSQRTLGAGVRGFYVGGEEDFNRSSGGDPILARPFLDIDVNAQSSLLVAFPGLSTGNVNVEATNSAYAFDVFLRKLLLSGYCNRLDFIGGYQHSGLKDEVDITNSSVNQDINRAPIGTEVRTEDSFQVDNQFHGGFIGLMGTSEDGPLSWNLLAKVAFGNMNQEGSIGGRTTSTVPGPGGSSAASDFGLLAQATNMGSFDQDEFALIPEINVNMGYNVSNNLRLTVGYTFIYWSEIALAGDMIDTAVSVSGNSRPSAQLQSDGFWYSGVSFGGSLRF